MDCTQYQEIIAAHVDGVLDDKEKRSVELHLQFCPRCAQKFRWESSSKRSLKGKLNAIPASGRLRERVVDQLERAAGVRRTRVLGQLPARYALVAAGVVLLIGVIFIRSVQETKREEIFIDAVAHYHNVVRGAMAGSGAVVSPTPTARLLDLSPWGYRALARQINNLGEYEGRLFVYQGPNREYLLAQEFEGADFQPPRSARSVSATNRSLIVYSHDGVNLIAWKENNIFCMIASTLPTEKLLDLARQLTLRG